MDTKEKSGGDSTEEGLFRRGGHGRGQGEGQVWRPKGESEVTVDMVI